MKFKYVGNVPHRNVTLELEGIIPIGTDITEGFEFEVDDKNTEMIKRLELTPNYKVVSVVKKKGKGDK